MPGHIGEFRIPGDHALGQADGLHEQRHGVAVAARVQQLAELRDVGPLPAGGVRVGHERWLPQRQLGDGQAGRCGVQDEDRAGGVPEDRGRPAAWIPREVDAPLTRTTGAPSPSRSKAMVVPSLERAVSMSSFPCERGVCSTDE